MIVGIDILLALDIGIRRLKIPTQIDLSTLIINIIIWVQIMTTSTTTNTTQTIKLLNLLQQYEILHTTANDNLKLSIFNITKARKFGSSSSGQQYSPDDVREELIASALLELQDDIGVDDNGIEPNLVHEDVLSSSNDDGGVKISSGGVSKGSRFVLYLDGMREVATAKQHTANISCQQLDDKTAGADNIESDGLRRRRKGKTTDTKSSSEENSSSTTKWTIEDETPNESSNNDKEQRLQNADPINLFGVPPPALKVAQTKSRYAIAYYVEVANLAREIMKITNLD